MKMLIVFLLCIFALCGCNKVDDQEEIRQINKCLFIQSGKVVELEKRIIDLEYKVKYFRDIEEKRMTAKLKEAKRWQLEKDKKEK